MDTTTMTTVMMDITNMEIITMMMMMMMMRITEAEWLSTAASNTIELFLHK